MLRFVVLLCCSVFIIFNIFSKKQSCRLKKIFLNTKLPKLCNDAKPNQHTLIFRLTRHLNFIDLHTLSYYDSVMFLFQVMENMCYAVERLKVLSFEM